MLEKYESVPGGGGPEVEKQDPSWKVEVVKMEDVGVHSTLAQQRQGLSAWGPSLGTVSHFRRMCGHGEGIPGRRRDPGFSVGEAGMKTDDERKGIGSGCCDWPLGQSHT